MRRFGAVWLCLVGAVLAALPAGAAVASGRPDSPPAGAATPPAGPPSAGPSSAKAAAAAAGFSHLPLRFEANKGQADAAAKFVVRSGGGVTYLTAHDALLTAPRKPDKPDAAPAGLDVVELSPAGASPDATVTGADRLPGVSNYIIGNDPEQWHTDVPAYARVRYAGVYPGVDLVYHGEGGQLEYDFEVAAGADPTPIAVAVHGGDRPVVDAKGDLVTHAGTTEVRQHRPVAYQDLGGARHPVEARFALRPDGSAGFALGAYDRTKALVIDPAIGYATYLGGSGEDAVAGIALDASDNAYLTGWTTSSNFPVAAALQGSCAKCNNAGFSGGAANSTAFVTKLNPTGTAVSYSTYLGGTNGFENGLVDYGGSIAVDSSGAAYVSGMTTSTDFPVVGGYKTTCGTVATPCISSTGLGDAFVARLAPAGSSLAYSTYIGGSGADSSRGLALGASGVAYVGGRTTSTDFVTANPGSAVPLQSSYGGGVTDDFVVRVNTAATGAASLVYSSYLGGSGSDEAKAVAVDPTNVVYVAGFTQSSNFPTANAYQSGLSGGSMSATVSKIDTTGGTSGLVYSSYVGGTSGGSQFLALAVKGGVAYVSGVTSSSTYPVTGTSVAYQATFGGGSDAVVTAVDTTLSGATSLRYSSFLGGSSGDTAYAVAVDAANLVTVAGGASSGFPLSGQIQNFDYTAHVFVARLDLTKAAAGLVYSTALAGNDGYAVAVDNASPANAYVGGRTGSGFPASSGAFQTTFGGGSFLTDGFVAKLTPGTQPMVSGLSVTHGPFTGGTSVVITGSGFTAATAVKFGVAPATSFTVNSATQITATAPCASGASPCPDTALSSVAASTVAVTVTAGGGTSVANLAAQFTYGEGESAPAAACTSCLPSYPGMSVALQNGRVLYTQTGYEPYADGIANQGSTTVTSATRTFTAADVGQRVAVGFGVFPRGTFIVSIDNAHSVTVSKPALASAAPENLYVSNNVTELYDPVADTWTLTGSCNGCGAANPIIGGATITVLSSGKVLVAGGMDPLGQAGTVYPGNQAAVGVPDAFVYDPAAGTWSATGPMSVARKAHTATLLAGGKVLVAGGSDVGQTPSPMDAMASAEVFDPSANAGAGAFSATAPMATKRALAAAALLPNNKVLVAGGYTTGTGVTVASAEQYDPVAGTWAPAGSMSQPRGNAAIVVLAASGACGANCGKALVVDGEVDYYTHLASAELYTPGVPGSWAAAGAPGQGRYPSTVATLLPSGKVLVSDRDSKLAERFDPATATWASAGANVSGTSAVVLPAGPASVCGNRCGQAFAPNDAAAASAFYVPRPTITALSPVSGGANTTVTLTGTGLTAVSAASFGGVGGTSLTYSTTSPDTSLTIKAPSGVSGAVTLLATSPGGVSSTAGPQFSFSNVPSVVQNLAAQAMNTAAALTWSPPASDGGSAISGYTVVTNAPSGGATHANVNVSPSSCSPTCSTTITGLSNSLTLAGQGAYSFTVYATNTNGNGTAATSAPTYPQVTAGTFVPLTPARLLDTRPAPDNWGTCTPSPCATVGQGATVSVQIAGQVPQGPAAPAPVPATGATAVVLNVTAVNATATGGGSYLTVWPSDATRPNSSNLNYAQGPSIANLVTVKLGADGRVKLFNNAGNVDIIADVVGYYVDGTGAAASRFNPSDPGRLLDTRAGSDNWGTCVPSPCATIGAGSTITVRITGQGTQGGGPPPVPVGAAGVILNVTTLNATAAGGGSYLTVWPADAPKPGTSNVNFSQGRFVSNLVAVKLAADGTVKLYNNSGSVDVIADVAGWYAPAGSIGGDRFTPTAPGRIYDTRPAPDNWGSCVPSPCGPIGAGASASALVGGQVSQDGATPVPASGASAVVANLTVVQPSGTGGASYLTAYPDGTTRPLASNLVYVDNQIVPILAAVKLGTNGRIRLYNNAGTANFIADVYGWFNNGTS